MHEPANLLTRDVLNNAVVHYEDGYARVFWGEYPLGGKVQTSAPRCRWWRHDWFIDEYPGAKRIWRDKVCSICSRRKPLN